MCFSLHLILFVVCIKNEKSCFSGSTGEKSKADKSWFSGSDHLYKPSREVQPNPRPIIEENHITDQARAEESKEPVKETDETVNTGEDFDESYITALLDDMEVDEESTKEEDEETEEVADAATQSSLPVPRKSVPEIRKQLETPRVYQRRQTEARKEASDLQGASRKRELWVEWVKHYQLNQKKHDTSHPGGLRVLVSNEQKLRELYKEFCIDQEEKNTTNRDSDSGQPETNTSESTDIQPGEPEQ